ncbi:hypothetical protein [Cellulomonas septica]|uniref:Barstar (barnase inhibitor) domain-containing protein n=1 Tax=Cellulomonas septica TaxID=285080 RepID=A0ABX1K0W2_9CELL|nr:hypothetical protein [Cellulomonas septica]NKY39886.1 hypothetical protein [Cellulomonas septica]
MTTVRYVDVEDALDFCELLDLVIDDEGALATALARPAVVVRGADAYEGVTDVLYRLNGYRLVADPHEVDRFVRAVGGDEHLPLEDVAAWLGAHARLLEN